MAQPLKKQYIILEYTSKTDLQDNINIQADNGYTLGANNQIQIIFDSANNPTYVAILVKSVLL